ncbi:MAG: nucleoid occlusion protein [Vallitaleaceae bacterium]|jgi:ParB family chromosome partitioning protein|nr:nucleoid occlusion protein [Vallitaleaceae bacterium]
MSLIMNNTIMNIPVDLIDPNPYQPRRHFDTHILKDLADSISKYGIMQPISVRKKGEDRYELVAGERRLRATKITDINTIPAILLDVSDEDSTILALIENLQRENLNFMEEAEGYFNLIHDYHMKQEEVAKQVGKNQSTIANKLRLLNLSEGIVKIIFENQLSERHARALLSLNSEKEQLEILAIIMKKSLNVKKTEELIKEYLLNQQKPKKHIASIRHYLKDIRIFTNTIKQAVDMMKTSGVQADYKIEQDEETYQITITIPMRQG